MRSMLIAFSHVLIMHLIMDSKNTASFLNRSLRPGINSLLSKHLVSLQVTAFTVSCSFLLLSCVSHSGASLSYCCSVLLPPSHLSRYWKPCSTLIFLRNPPSFDCFFILLLSFHLHCAIFWNTSIHVHTYVLSTATQGDSQDQTFCLLWRETVRVERRLWIPALPRTRETLGQSWNVWDSVWVSVKWGL